MTTLTSRHAPQKACFPTRSWRENRNQSLTRVALSRNPSCPHTKSSQLCHSRHCHLPHVGRPPPNPHPIHGNPRLQMARTFPTAWLRPSKQSPWNSRHGRNRTRRRGSRSCIRDEDPISQPQPPSRRPGARREIREL